MSPQSTFAFVLLAAFAISTPVQTSLIKTDTVSYTDLTTALCASLHYTPRGVNSLFDACVASKLLVTANAHTTRAILKSGLTTAVCTSLDLKVIGSSQIHDACVAAGLLVTADLALKPQEIKLSSSTDLYANAFLSSANGCNSLSSQLSSLLAGVARLTVKTVASLSVDVIIPTILKIDASINDAVVVTANSVSCTDAAVEATVLQSYTAFVTGFSSLLSSLSTSLSLCSSAEVKSLHAALAHLRSTLVLYTQHLDNYLAADLEQSSVKAALFLSLDAAVHATA